MKELWFAWAAVILVGGLWLYLSAASMLGSYLGQRRAAEDRLSGAPEGINHQPGHDIKHARSGK